ncbi:MAG: GNVR domain-containing protein [Pseudomonadota bacterium]
MEDQVKELRDYIDAFRRRRSAILLVAAALFAVSLLVAALWPPTYRSSATILIEEQAIPSELVRSTVTSYAAQRIHIISQRVMTRANLMEIIEKYNLYPDKRRKETTEEILERMRKDISLQMINADVVDPRSGQATKATIAFTLAFESDDARVAQKVANELTTLYLNENLKTRADKAAETTTFLSSESERLGRYIAELETKLADFKKKNADSLPGSSQLNMQLIDRTERELSDIDSKLRLLDDRKVYLEGMLSQISPMGSSDGKNGEKVQDPITRLKMLRSEYINLSARYSPDHPDVVRIKYQIGELEKQTGYVDTSATQAKELAKLREELSAARQKYSDEHPDVIRLANAVAAQEEEFKKLSAAKPEMLLLRANPENPAYITMKAQIEAAKTETETLTARQRELNAKLTDYEKRMVQSPEVEREYLTLMRDYDNSVRKYQDIKAKQLEAEVGQELEKERKGERFSLIDPPQLPEEPIKPNRPGIVILGLLLSITGSFGYAFVAESMDSSVRGAKAVAAILEAPPLSVIPYMSNREDSLRSERKKRIATAAFVGGFVVLVILAHFLWTPLDVLWFKGLRKVDTVIGG